MNCSWQHAERKLSPGGSRLAAVGVAGLLALLAGGCGGESSADPVKIEARCPTCTAAPLGAAVPLKIQLPGKAVPTLLGGKRDTLAANVRVRFALTGLPEKSDARLESPDVRSDPGGQAACRLVLGDVPGIYRVRVTLPDYPEVSPLSLVVLGGVTVSGNQQDAGVGQIAPQPLVLKAESRPGLPREGVRVIFSAVSDVEVFGADARTGENGEAKAYLRLGKKPGQKIVLARVLDDLWRVDGEAPELRLQVFALDWWGLAIEVLGGLAIFIYGMKLMSDGLSLAAGNGLKAILNLLTRNRFLAVGAGLLTTGLIQSSSACTVMVIGFVNAGLMTLEQAIGVIMGANIGTTVTAQMLSFQLGALALPAIAVGVTASLLCRQTKYKYAAQILIGFGLLFFGMEFMGAPLKLLKDSAAIVSFFDGLSCAPDHFGHISLAALLKAVAAGTLMTLIVQSSSATIGLLLAMAGAGLLDIYTATGVLFGDNIGTTITAVLASLGASKTARQAAIAHVLFNVIGVLFMLVLFFVPWNGHPVFLELVAHFTPGDSFRGENLPRFLANAHTGFNVACTLVFIWFVAAFAWACRRLVKGSDLPEDRPLRLLDPNLLAAPEIALGQAWAELGVMLQKGHAAYRLSFDAILGDGDADWKTVRDAVRKQEEEIDELQSAITSYVIHLSQENLTEPQSATLPRLLHAVNDAERIGDQSMQLLRLARRRRKQELQLDSPAATELRALFAFLENLFLLVAEVLKRTAVIRADVGGESAARQLTRTKELIKQLKRQGKECRRLHEQPRAESSIPGEVIYADALRNLLRVGAHLENISLAVLLTEPVEPEEVDTLVMLRDTNPGTPAV